MSYQIEYDLTGNAKRIPCWKRMFRMALNIALVVCVIVLLFWMGDGNRDITALALDTMAENLNQGSSIQEAFSKFCIDILSGAGCV